MICPRPAWLGQRQERGSQVSTCFSKKLLLTGVMLVQARMQMNERQAELLVGCRRTLLRELGSLIGERDRLWTDLQVGPTICGSQS